MAHCAVIRRFVSIWRRGLPLQRPDIPHHKHQNPSEGVEDAIDREFNDLFDQWRKLTNEILSEPTERYEIGESVLLGKAISYPAQVNSVIGVYILCVRENSIKMDRSVKRYENCSDLINILKVMSLLFMAKLSNNFGPACRFRLRQKRTMNLSR